VTTVVRILVLGPVELVTADGVRVPLGGPKPKALLAALVRQRARVVSLTQIVDLIWDSSPPSTANASVHTYVSALRRGLVAAGGSDATLTTRAPGYLLNVPAADTDLGAFATLVDRARRAERERAFADAVAGYDAALKLWRGSALGGVDAGFARSWAAALLEERLGVEEGRARAVIELGRPGDALTGLTRLVAAYPLREEGRALLMRALHLTGRQAEALEVYRAGRTHLLDELGIEPGERLRALHAEVLAGPAPRPAPARTAPGDRRGAPRNLPPDIGDFTGRDEDLAALLRMGAEPDKRTVVVSGFGGAGKSALAVHAAHLMSARFPDGQLFADLRGAGRELDAHEVLGRFLQAMGTPAAAVPVSTDERVERYRSCVAGRRMIIVLDNARGEHQVRPLLPGDPGSLVVITSRSRLTGLESPESIELGFLSQDSATAMLGKIIGTDRASAQPADAERIARLCGGVPLAVRAAGAKLLARPHWPLKSLVVRLSDERRRLDELTVGDLAIRSSLGLNYAELDERQRRAFHLLCLLDLPDFGWWPVVPLLGDAVRDAQDAEDIVEHLVDLRLVDVAGVDPIGRVRYRLHDLVQLFGAEQAAAEAPGEVTAAVSRTLETWMSLVTAATRGLPRITVPPRRAAAAAGDVDPVLVEDVEDDPAGWLMAEAAAVVRVVERAHALGVGHGTTIALASLLAAPFAAGNEFDAWQRTHEVAVSAARANADRGAEAVVLAGLGQLHAEKDDFPAALDHFRRSRDLAAEIGDDDTVALALVGMGGAHRDLAEFDAALRDLSAAAELGERTGNRDVVAAANYGLGAISREHGHIAEATERLTRCAELYREAGDRRGMALALRGLSLCERAVAGHAAAADLAAEAAAILTDVGDELGAAYARQSWAKASLRLGHDPAAVEAAVSDCLEVCTRRGDRFGIALMTRTLGEVALATGDLASARTSLAAALLLWTELDLPLWQARTLRDLAAATVTGDEEAALAHWDRARELCAGTQARDAAELAALTPAAWLRAVSEARL
jgi:DNA-binding SARP family transcriptional activator/tetratricopeptide (TPR) repeat protein